MWLAHPDSAPPCLLPLVAGCAQMASGEAMSVPKQKPTFSGVEALRPDTSGWNLVVKVGGRGAAGQRERRRVGANPRSRPLQARPRGCARPDLWDLIDGSAGSGRADGAGLPHCRGVCRRLRDRPVRPRSRLNLTLLPAPPRPARSWMSRWWWTSRRAGR